MKTRLLSIAFLLTLVLGAAFSMQAVQAQTASQEQELEQEVSVNCSTGSYGQGQNCDVTTKQRGKQKQEIVFRKDGRVLAAHQVVNTALDLKTIIVAGGLLALGAASTYAFVKTNRL